MRNLSFYHAESMFPRFPELLENAKDFAKISLNDVLAFGVRWERSDGYFKALEKPNECFPQLIVDYHNFFIYYEHCTIQNVYFEGVHVYQFGDAGYTVCYNPLKEWVAKGNLLTRQALDKYTEMYHTWNERELSGFPNTKEGCALFSQKLRTLFNVRFLKLNTAYIKGRANKKETALGIALKKAMQK